MTAVQKLAADAECRITCVRAARDGTRTYWTARITVQGQTFDCHNKWGAWFVEVGERSRHVLPAYAARLQARVASELRKTGAKA